MSECCSTVSILELLQHTPHVIIHVLIVLHGFLYKLPHDLWPGGLQDLHLLVPEQGRFKKIRGEDSSRDNSVLLCHTQRLWSAGIVMQTQPVHWLHAHWNTFK